MKLTLRKAHRLVKELQSHLRVRDAVKNIHHTASEEEVKTALEAVELQNKEAVLQTLRVVEAISIIRAALQEANGREVDGNTIDSLLNRKVQIETTMRVLANFRAVSGSDDSERLVETVRRVKDLSETKTAYSQQTHLQVTGVAVADHNEFNELYITLKQEQEKVSDTLAYINNKLEVEIDDKFSDLFKVLQVL